MIGSNNRISLHKDQMSNKTRFFSMQALLKNQKFNYTTSSILILIFILIFSFQNCAKNSSKNGGGPIERASVGDKAIFKLSEKYTGHISNIFWQVKRSDTVIATGKKDNIEMNWNNILEDRSDRVIEAFMQLGGNSCITYRELYIGTLMRLISDPTYTSEIISTPSPDESPVKEYFPIGTLVDLKIRTYGVMVSVPPDFNSFQWSIKRLFLEDDTELADQTNKTEKLTYTFSEVGLYNISVEAFGPDATTSTNTQLLIERCEGDDLDDVEIVLSGDSIGAQTPEEISNLRPIWNYIRPADTDPNVDIMTLATDNSIDNRRFFGFGGYVYKYPRDSSSKFIDIDIQNADECFLDTEPLSTTECDPSGCSSDAADCNCEIFYEIRENLSSLSSCSGNALDMSTLDTDTTQCTDAVFVVAASKTGQESKVEKVFYKHCPANQDYCYFGEEYDRPSDHQCPSS